MDRALSILKNLLVIIASFGFLGLAVAIVMLIGYGYYAIWQLVYILEFGACLGLLFAARKELVPAQSNERALKFINVAFYVLVVAGVLDFLCVILACLYWWWSAAAFAFVFGVASMGCAAYLRVARAAVLNADATAREALLSSSSTASAAASSTVVVNNVTPAAPAPYSFGAYPPAPFQDPPTQPGSTFYN